MEKDERDPEADARAKAKREASVSTAAAGSDDYTAEEQLDIAEGEYMDRLERANAVLGDIATSYKTTYSAFMAGTYLL